MPLRRVIVVGGGLGGCRTVEALRKHGYEGSLTLVCGEPHAPYDRPPLSKQFLTGDSDDSTLRESYEDLGVELVLGRHAAALGEGRLELDDGTVLPWDGAVIATGSSPFVPPGLGLELEGVFVLRTVEDARGLRSHLVEGARVVVIGAGFIGAEVATSARTRGCAVTVLELFDTPLQRALGPEAGRLTAPWYEEHGVDLRCGCRVEGLAGAGRVSGVRTAGGETIPADVVLVATGVRPVTAWLEGAPRPLRLDDGVVVDETLSTGVPGLYAVGDVARAYHPLFRTDLRVEHWETAVAGARVAAANLLGGEAVHDSVPYFWSEQFGRFVQYVGHRGEADELVVRGDPVSGPGSVFFLEDGRLVAALTVDRQREMVAARRLISQRSEPDVELLGDPAHELAAAAA